VARYYTLSDNSLHFVKLLMPDGREYTLPNAVSASGARYTDDRELVWWTKGDSAFVQTRDRNGEWQIMYNNCGIIRDKD
jgi:membrane-bound inhibitor of C-type lysozyme